MRLNTTRGTPAVKMSVTETETHSGKENNGNNLIVSQMNLGYEFCHKARCKMVPVIYSHFL